TTRNESGLCSSRGHANQAPCQDTRPREERQRRARLGIPRVRNAQSRGCGKRRSAFARVSSNRCKCATIHEMCVARGGGKVFAMLLVVLRTKERNPGANAPLQEKATMMTFRSMTLPVLAVVVALAGCTQETTSADLESEGVTSTAENVVALSGA